MGKAAKFLYLLSGRLGGLLGDYGGAAAAYSLRNLSTSTTNVVKVRRDSDDSEQDFTASDITDGTLLSFVNADVEKIVNGDFATDTDWTKGTGWSISGGTANCDGTQTSNSEFKTTVGIAVQGVQVTFSFVVKNYSAGTLNATLEGTGTLDFSGINANGVYSTTATSSDPLPKVTFTASSDFIGSIDDVSVIQSTANGLVTTWYDQSGNGNNATQATAANQPKIVSSGTLVTENGKAAVDFDGTDDHLITLTAYPTGTNESHFYVASSMQTGGRVIDTRGTGAPGGVQGWQSKFNNPSTDLDFVDDGASGVLDTSGISRSGQNLASSLFSQTELNSYTNGVLVGTDTGSIGSFDSGNDLYIGANVNGANSQIFDGTIQEIVLYPSDQSANRTGIEANINDYYNIYP